MPPEAGITFAIALNSRYVFERNFLASPCLRGSKGHEVLVQERFRSAATAYNDAIDRAANDLIVFCHQDVVLPAGWLSRLSSALEVLDAKDPNWGVLGAYGNTRDGRGWGQVYSSGLGVIGEPLTGPCAVQTLDEIVLILKRSSGLRFDDALPHFHFYGTDICLRAARMGMRSYAIPAFCIHNTSRTPVLPKEFYVCCRHIKQVWHKCLPIQTSCVRITYWNVPVFTRRLRELYLRYVRRQGHGGRRVQDPLALLDEFTAL